MVEEFSRPRANGINAITINMGDQLIEARLTNGKNEILIANKQGRAIRFNESKVRSMGRSAAGVTGMELDKTDDEVIGMICVDPEDKTTSILAISELGSGKRTDLEDYRVTNRSGKGVKTLNITEKTGNLVSIKAVSDLNDLIITTRQGIMIRLDMSNLRIMGRATQGVKLIKLDDQDEIADVTVILKDIEDDKPIQEEDGNSKEPDQEIM